MADIQHICERYSGQKDALLPILQDIQDELGYIPDDAVDEIAAAVGQSHAEVYGVIHFYHDLKTKPNGRHEIKICRAEACQSVGAEKLVQDLLTAFGLDDFGTTSDGKVTIEAVYCLGLCPLSPSAMIDGKPMGRANVNKMKEAIV